MRKVFSTALVMALIASGVFAARYEQLDVGVLSLAGTEITATAAELNLAGSGTPASITTPGAIVGQSTLTVTNGATTLKSLTVNTTSTLTGNVVAQGTLTLTNGAATVKSAVVNETLGVTGNSVLQGTLTVTNGATRTDALNIGHASDTTITRASAGDIAVEGNTVYRAGGTDVAVADGGTGLGSGTSGGVLAFTAAGTIASSAELAQYGIVLGGGAGAVPATLAASANTGAPLLSAGASANPAYGPLNLAGGATIVSGDLPVADGGTGISTGTDHGVVVASGTDPFTVLAVGSDNQVLKGSTGADPAFGALVEADIPTLAASKIAGTAVTNASYNEIIAYLADGVLIDGTLAISATPEQFKTTSTAVYTLAGVCKTKAAEDNLTFSAADTINTAAGAGLFYGIWLVQVDGSGTVSTKSPSADQVYASSAAAIAALPSADTDNVGIGYILIQSKDTTKWTANTDDMTAASDCQTSSFVDVTVKSLPSTLP